MSKKRSAQLKLYKGLREDYLKEHPMCAVCDTKASQDVHHKAGRGPNMLEVDTWLAVCRQCHDDIHFGSMRGKGPKWARENGYLI